MQYVCLLEYYEYFAPDFSLHPIIGTKHENTNTKQVSIFVSSLWKHNALALQRISYIFTTYRQIWLTMFITLLPNSHLWIIHMVGYHCSSLRKTTLEQK